MFFWLKFIDWHFALSSLLPIEDIPIFVRVNFTQHGFFYQGIMKLLFTVNDLTFCSLHQAWKQGLFSIFESEVAQSCPTLCDPLDCSLHQVSPSMGFSRQEYWSGLPFPSTGDLPNPGLEPRFPTLQADALPSEPPGKPKYNFTELQKGPPFQPASPSP